MKKLLTLTTLLLFTALLAACAGQSAELTPTPVDVAAIQTQAVQTVVAAVTQTAAALPTETPAPPTETLVPTETLTPTPENTATATINICNNSVFVSDVSVPDGSQMTAGQKFVKTWKVRNTGSCTWATTYTIRYGYGDRLSGRDTYLTATTLPGEEAEISIELTAPNTPGTYRGYWVLFDNNAFSFGQYLSVIITVP